MQRDFELLGKIALVTGASRGLGAAAAKALAQAGAKVILTDINDAGLSQQVADFTANQLKAHCVHLDVANEAQVADVTASLLRAHGHIDILINNAGVILRKPVVETSADEFRNVLNVNLVSMFSLAKSLVPTMVANGYGRIINLSSIMGHIGRAGQATYIASKHGVVGLTKALAAEFGPQGITCNAIAPGYFYTEMNQQIVDDQVFHNSVVSRTPLRRWAEPGELGGTIVYLASEASKFVTGQTILLDGGMTVTVPSPGSGDPGNLADHFEEAKNFGHKNEL